MPRFAANLSMLFTELPFLDRFAAARQTGFEAVEFLFPYAWPAKQIRELLDEHRLLLVLHNLPAGDWEAGERGIACLPDRVEEFRAGVHRALDYAQALGVSQLNCLMGKVPQGLASELVDQTVVDNLRYAAAALKEQQIRLLIEPINTRDIPHYFLNRQAHAHAIIEEVGAANLKVQMDLYHCQIVEGDVASKIAAYLPTGRVGHFQIAGVPQRHEPDVGELHHPHLFEVIDQVSAQCGWQGHIGCEYRPLKGGQAGGTSAGLNWFRSATHP